MFNTKLLVIAILVSVVIVSGCIEKPKVVNPDDYSIANISSINSGIEPGEYSVRAFLIEKYECPPCPLFALCEQCLSDYIVISENKKELDPDNALDDLIISSLYVDTSQLETGKEYNFVVKIYPTYEKRAYFDFAQFPDESLKLLGYKI